MPTWFSWGTIGHNARSDFGKIYGFVLEKIISGWVELKGVRARGLVGFKEDRFTLDDIFTLHTLIEQEIFVGRCLYSCFVDFKKALDTTPHDKLWEGLQRLGIPPHLQQAIQPYTPQSTQKFE